MKVTADGPETVHQQETGLGLTVRLVLGVNVLWLASPNEAVTIRLTKDVPLMIRFVVHPNTNPSTKRNESGQRKAQLGRIVGQIESGAGVDRWYPNEAAPTNVVAGAIVLNVHTVKVCESEDSNIEKGIVVTYEHMYPISQ